MQRLEVSGAVRPIYGSLGVKRLIEMSKKPFDIHKISKKKKGFIDVFAVACFTESFSRDGCHHLWSRGAVGLAEGHAATPGDFEVLVGV